MSIVDMQDSSDNMEEEFASLDEMVPEEESVEDSLDAEAEAEAPEEDKAEFELPDKFKGKGLEDVVHSYTELEREFGRRNNEIGELRKLTDELLNLQLSEKKKSEEPEYNLDVDSLLDNPNEAISKAVENHPKIRQFEQERLQARIDADKASFESVHPDWQDIVQSSDFSEWLQESPVRLRMFQEANEKYDYVTGGELFSTYKLVRGAANASASEEKNEKAKQALKKGAVEKGSSRGTTKKVYRRADLVNLKLKDPGKYAAMEAEIMKAYAEGRVR